MSSTREVRSIFDGEDRVWIRDYLQPRYPELVEPYLEASRLYQKPKKRFAMTAHALATLTLHASSSRTPLGENVAAMLGELYDIDRTIEPAIRELAAGQAVHQRVNALIALGSCATSDLHEELFVAALADRSARVRALAADMIVSRDMRHLVGQLNEALRNEPNRKLKEELQADIDYLTQGYRLRFSAHFVWVTCRTGGSSISTSFTNEDFESKGRAWIKKQLSSD